MRYCCVDNYEQAIEVLEKAYALPKNPKTQEVVKSCVEAYELSCKYKDAISVLEKYYLSQEVDTSIGSTIERLYFNMLQHNKSDAISVVGNILSKVEVSDDLGLIYKKILVSYHKHLGEELAEAIVKNCTKGRYGIVESHIAILQSAIEEASASFSAESSNVEKQIRHLHLYLARNFRDLLYLDKVDDSLFSSDELARINEIRADVYFTKARHSRHEQNFNEAIEYLEKARGLDPSREGL